MPVVLSGGVAGNRALRRALEEFSPICAHPKYSSDNAVGADLFICEGMYGENGKESKAREYRHMTMYEAAGLAKTANVREMWLTHYSPSLVRPEEFLNDVRRIFPNTKMPRDGWNKTIDFEEN